MHALAVIGEGLCVDKQRKVHQVLQEKRPSWS